jgi:hypothetical protein
MHGNVTMAISGVHVLTSVACAPQAGEGPRPPALDRLARWRTQARQLCKPGLKVAVGVNSRWAPLAP